MDDKEKDSKDMKEKFQTIREFFASLREAIIVLLFLFLIFFPNKFKERLAEMGFEVFEWGGLKLNLKEQYEKAKNAGQQVDELKTQSQQIYAALDSVSKRIGTPGEKKLIDSLKMQTGRIISLSSNLDNNMKTQLAVQEQVLTKSNLIEQAEEGWIYAGKINEAKTQWERSVKKTIAESVTDFKPGHLITIVDDVYLRSGKDERQFKSAKILSVIKEKEKVEFIAIDYSHAIGGGWFVWLKVRRTE